MTAFRHRLVLAVLGGALALGAAAPAPAALFDDNEARQRIEATNQRLDQVQRQLQDRIAALETQIKNLGLVDMFNQIEQIKGDVAKLRGQIEVITFELSEAQKRQRELYVDLDSRLRRLEAQPAGTGSSGAPRAQPAGSPAPAGAPPGSAAAPPETAPPSSLAPPSVPSGGAAPPSASGTGSMPPPVGGSFGPPGASAPGMTRGSGAGGVPGATRPSPVEGSSEQRAYDSALDLFKSGNYGAAVASFATFVRTYPRSPLAPSAQYWIGNAQFAMRDFRAAIASQRQLIANYPDSAKVPDAMLNIATSQFEVGDTAQSRRTLDDLIARYPQSEAAAKARQRLAPR